MHHMALSHFEITANISWRNPRCFADTLLLPSPALP